MGHRMTSPEIESLEAEVFALKRQLLEARQALAPEPVTNYVFRLPNGAPITLLELFGEQKDLIVIHNMGRSCVYCTLWADGFKGLVPHLEDRAAFVLVSPDSPSDVQSFAESRGWNFRCVSGEESDFAEAMGFWSAVEGYAPGVSTFCLEGQQIKRVASSEFGPGDSFCALWPMLDLLDGGPRGWEPEYEYPVPATGQHA